MLCFNWHFATGDIIVNRTHKKFNNVKFHDIWLGSLSKTTWWIFSVKGGGYPPFPLRVFGQEDFPLRGEGGTPQFR